MTLDEDVAALLTRVRQAHDLGLNEAVNEGLRQGLPRMISPPASDAPFATRPVDPGRCLLGSFDDIVGVLAITEGDDHR